MKKIFVLISIILFISICYAQAEDVGITFEFENGEVIVENSQEYYAFDIMAYASATGTKIGTGIVYINYSTAGFGQDIYGNSKVTVTKGSLTTNAGAPLYNLQLNDNTSSRLAVTFEYNSDPGWGNNLPTTPTDLIHVKIDIADENQTAGLSFENSLMTGTQYYDDNATTYYPVIATDTDNTDLPVAQKKDNIEDFSGSHILTHPNPFNSYTSNIELKMLAPKTGIMSLKVYNIKGQYISKIYEDFHQKNDIVNSSWNGTNSKGQKLSSGVYLFQLLVDKETHDSKKILLIR